MGKCTVRVLSLHPAGTIVLGAAFAKHLQQNRVLLLRGDLGSGKTCFVHGLAQGLGIKAQVHSPTYTLINEYTLPNGGTLYHVDCYRTGKNDHLLQETVAEVLLDQRNLLVVEWAEQLPATLPKPFWQLQLTYVDESQRRFCYTHTS